MKQTHDKKVAENLSPLTKKLENVNESTQKLIDVIKETNSENETPLLQFKTGTQSLPDTSSFMKRSNIFFKLVQKPNGDVFWTNVLSKRAAEKIIEIEDKEYVLTPDI